MGCWDHLSTLEIILMRGVRIGRLVQRDPLSKTRGIRAGVGQLGFPTSRGNAQLSENVLGKPKYQNTKKTTKTKPTTGKVHHTQSYQNVVLEGLGLRDHNVPPFP